MSDSYVDHTLKIEERQHLAGYAKRSFESTGMQFVDGEDAREFFEKRWRNPDTALKLRNRTPLQIERDRILYSDLLRKQTDKYHVLYSGNHRIVRNYTTHTMRMTQVVRSICRSLRLNSDFAEALALGSKMGATPFIHAAKEAVPKWLGTKIESIDREKRKLQKEPSLARRALQLKLFQQAESLTESGYPAWIERLESDYAIERVRRFVPWARGSDVDAPYYSGQESYWLLTVDPFTRELREGKFFPETLYGIWRHSISHRPLPNSFHHRLEVPGAFSGFQEIRWNHATYEAAVVQYADDISWVIENLNDANRVALASGQQNLYNQILRTTQQDIMPATLLRALSAADSGALYTYFIETFISYALEKLDPSRAGQEMREALRAGSEAAFLTLPEEAEEQLLTIKNFLADHVFVEKRVKHRRQMLSTIMTACLDILFEGKDDLLPKIAEERARIEEWPREDLLAAKALLEDDIHRAQLAVDIFAEMGDQDIYDFVGIQSL